MEEGLADRTCRHGAITRNETTWLGIGGEYYETRKGMHGAAMYRKRLVLPPSNPSLRG